MVQTKQHILLTVTGVAEYDYQQNGSPL